MEKFINKNGQVEYRETDDLFGCSIETWFRNLMLEDALGKSIDEIEDEMNEGNF